MYPYPMMIVGLVFSVLGVVQTVQILIANSTIQNGYRYQFA